MVLRGGLGFGQESSRHIKRRGLGSHRHWRFRGHQQGRACGFGHGLGGGGQGGMYPPFNEAGSKKPLVDNVVQACDPTCRFGVERMSSYS